MGKAERALTFVGTVLIEGTSGAVYSVSSGAVTARTRLSLGQKTLAKTLVGFVGGGLVALAGAPRIGAGIANASLTILGEGIAEKTRFNQRVDRLLSGNSTAPSGAIGRRRPRGLL